MAFTEINWHNHRPELAGYINRNDRAGFDAALSRVLANARGIGTSFLVNPNEVGEAYNAMGQSDIAVVLALAAKTWRDPALLAMAISAMAVVVTPIAEGGLAYVTKRGVWYCSQTDTADKGLGGTLNQHLVTCRNLRTFAELIGDEKWRKAALAGITQLLQQAFAPALDDFVPRDEKSGKPIQRSWLYYGASRITTGGPRGYFLDRLPWKNGNYHLLVMQLLSGFESFPEVTRLIKAPNKALAGQSAAQWLLGTYKAKQKDGLYVPSRSKAPGRFAALDRDHTEPLEDRVVEFFTRMSKVR